MFLARRTLPEEPFPKVFPSFQGPTVSLDFLFDDFVVVLVLNIDSGWDNLFVASLTDWTTLSNWFWETLVVPATFSIAFLAAFLATEDGWWLLALLLFTGEGILLYCLLYWLSSFNKKWNEWIIVGGYNECTMLSSKCSDFVNVECVSRSNWWYRAVFGVFKPRASFSVIIRPQLSPLWLVMISALDCLAG